MKHLLPPLLLALFTNAACAAITITITPDDRGGTIFLFSQTAANPGFLISDGAAGGFHIELPPGVFSPLIIAGGGQSSDISGPLNPILATFTDVNSGFSYNVSSLRIGGDLSFGEFGFDRPFLPAPGRMEGRLDLTGGAAAGSEISPAALMVGTHTVSSVLFDTVTVNVIPEPGPVPLVLLSPFLLAGRHRRPAIIRENRGGGAGRDTAAAP